MLYEITIIDCACIEKKSYNIYFRDVVQRARVKRTFSIMP